MTKDAFSLEIEMQRQAWFKEAVRMSAMATLPILLWVVAAFLLFLSRDAPFPFRPIWLWSRRSLCGTSVLQPSRWWF